MVIVEGRCTKLQLLIFYVYNDWLLGSDWSDGLVWSNIAVPFFYHPINMIIALEIYQLITTSVCSVMVTVQHIKTSAVSCDYDTSAAAVKYFCDFVTCEHL